MGKKKQCQISFSWAPKSLWTVTAATKLKDACSLEEKLLQTLDSVLKSRDMTLLTKVCTVKAIVIPIVMYKCESWSIKKTVCHRSDTFKLWCWRSLLRATWIARRSKQSILKEISPEYSFEGLMMKLKLQYLATTVKDPDTGNDWRREEKGLTEDEMVGWHHWLDGHEFEQALGVGDGQGSLACCSPWDRKEKGTTEQLNWIDKRDKYTHIYMYILQI